MEWPRSLVMIVYSHFVNFSMFSLDPRVYTIIHNGFRCFRIDKIVSVCCSESDLQTVVCVWMMQLPFLLGVPFLEKLAAPIAPIVTGRTGSQLFLTDGKPNRPPLLLQMTTDSEAGKFMWVYLVADLFLGYSLHLLKLIWWSSLQICSWRFQMSCSLC